MSNPSQDRCLSLRLTYFFVGALIGILGGFATFSLLPRQYRATTTIQAAPPSGSTLSPSAYLESQYQIILSQAVLDPVIQGLNLPQRWNLDPAQALLRVQSAASLQDVAGTDLLQLGILNPDPAQAVELANAIAESYQKLRVTETSQLNKEALAQLQLEINRLREKVDSLQSRPGPELDQAVSVLKAAEARLSSESLNTISPKAPVTIWEHADLARTTPLPLPWLLLLAGPLVGIFLGTALALSVRSR